eukprot:6153953-Pyramimonas_sp.AAC.1
MARVARGSALEAGVKPALVHPCCALHLGTGSTVDAPVRRARGEMQSGQSGGAWSPAGPAAARARRPVRWDEEARTDFVTHARVLLAYFYISNTV